MEWSVCRFRGEDAVKFIDGIYTQTSKLPNSITADERFRNIAECYNCNGNLGLTCVTQAGYKIL